MYLCTKFQVFSVSLTSFRRGNFTHPLPPQNGPIKSPPRLWLNIQHAQVIGKTIVELRIK